MVCGPAVQEVRLRPCEGPGYLINRIPVVYLMILYVSDMYISSYQEIVAAYIHA